jgi:hypothetical protein
VQLDSGEFIEIHAILKKPSLVDTIEGLKRLMEIASLFNQTNANVKPDKGRRIAPQKNIDRNIVVQQMDGMLKALTQSSSQELIGELTNNKEIRIVLDAELDYFNNKTATEAIDGEFYIFGKIIRVIKPGSQDTINLLRNTSFRQLDITFFNQFASAFENIKGLNFPEMITEIKSPAIHVLPIAIFT